MDDTLIGKEVTTIEGKTIIIKAAKDVNDEAIYSDTDGNIYTEDELNISYRLTPWKLLYDAITSNGIKLPAWDGDKWEKVFEEFMQEMVRTGYVEDKL